MRSLMNKCLNCLTVSATEDDPQAIEQLVVYYREGIGTPKNEELAVYWENYREELLAPKEEVNAAPDTIVIDHIYFRGKLRCQRFETLKGDYGAPYISDHYPIAAVFALQ